MELCGDGTDFGVDVWSDCFERPVLFESFEGGMGAFRSAVLFTVGWWVREVG